MKLTPAGATALKEHIKKYGAKKGKSVFLKAIHTNMRGAELWTISQDKAKKKGNIYSHAISGG